jgi:hypothetical protein
MSSLDGTWRAFDAATVLRWVGGGAAVFMLVFYGVHARTPPAEAPATASAELPIPSLANANRYGAIFQGAPKQGEVMTYRFTWNHGAENHLLPTAQAPDVLGESAIGLTGNLRLAVLLPKDGLGVMELSVENTKPIAADARSAQLGAMLTKQILGRTAYLVIHPDGALQSIRFAEGSPAGFQNFVQRIVGIMMHARAKEPGGREMVVSETTPFGTASTKYELRPDGQIYRSRISYTQLEGAPPGTDLANFGQELDSGALFTFRADGVLSQLTDSESLRLTRSEDGAVALRATHGFSLRLEDSRASEGEAPPARLGAFAAHAPWERAIDEASERQAVEDRLEGLTAAGLVQHVRAVAAFGPKAPDQLKFFNRATGLLKLHPEIGAQLVELLHEPKMTYEGRAFALDILASAGNDVVQAALVRALKDPRTRALPEYLSLYQRISLVRAPSDATVAFAEDTFERLHEATPRDQDAADLRTASVYTLGSVAGHMAQTLRLDAAERVCRRIVEKMDEGKGSPKVAYITALGNAGVPAEEPLLLRLSDDAEQDTRAAAINALRKYDTPASRGRLVVVLTAPVGVARNVDLATQAEALRAFELMTPERKDIQALAAAIVKDTLHPDLYGDVIPVFRKGKAPLADVSAALDAMFERSAQHDGDLQTRIDTLRAELSGLE